jgi:hypothetical protein
LSIPSYDYWKGSSYSGSSYKPPRYYYPKLKFGMEGLKQKVRRKFKPTPDSFGLMPDFTARALGLEAKQVGSVKDALREIKRLQTGFEIRTGARIKGMNEKNLMKGVVAW